VIVASEKTYNKTERLRISTENSRDEIIEAVLNSAEHLELSQLALYIYREMDRIDWMPFLKAAIERNPVCFTDLKGKDISEVYNILQTMSDDSIYDGQRLALPDEVWNFKRGDGIEKALLLADFIIHQHEDSDVGIEISNHHVTLNSDRRKFHFNSHKKFSKLLKLGRSGYQIN
jgi:hypothetical protein